MSKKNHTDFQKMVLLAANQNYSKKLKNNILKKFRMPRLVKKHFTKA